MELKIVEVNGARQFDMSVAQANFDKYSEECNAIEEALYVDDRDEKYYRGLNNALKRSQYERNNAARILTVLKSLSFSYGEVYCFLTKDGFPAIPSELLTEESVARLGYEVIAIADVKKVKCPGCTKEQAVIKYLIGRENELVICGNSLHIL